MRVDGTRRVCGTEASSGTTFGAETPADMPAVVENTLGRVWGMKFDVFAIRIDSGVMSITRTLPSGEEKRLTAGLW